MADLYLVLRHGQPLEQLGLCIQNLGAAPHHPAIWWARSIYDCWIYL